MPPVAHTYLNHALEAARRGFGVLPWSVKNGRKIPHIQAWQNNATSDLKQIRQWWDRWPSPFKVFCFVLVDAQ